MEYARYLSRLYLPGQWVALFFVYCLIGWIWESNYVSFKEKHWVNRGFMKGPCLPIYGVGGILMFIVGKPFGGNVVGAALACMFSADLMEYITGEAMERMFRVRYWDYSDQKFNLNGHICLSSTICWGVMSFLVIRYVQPFLGSLIVRIPYPILERVDFAVIAVAAGDFATSFKAAIDLRNLLIKTEAAYKRLNELQKELTERAAETVVEMKDRTVDTVVGVKDRTVDTVVGVKDRVVDTVVEVKDSAAETVVGMKDRTVETVVEMKDRTVDTVASMKDRTVDTVTSMKDRTADALSETREKIAQLQSSMKYGYTDSIGGLLKRNPDAVVRSNEGRLRRVTESLKEHFEHMDEA